MTEIPDIAERLRLKDIFALRRIADDQLVNLDGYGRGAGWAGNISIDPVNEPLIESAIGSTEIVRHAGETVRVFGPYWTDCAVIVSIADFIFVMGGTGVTDHDDDTIIEAAGEIAWIVSTVPPEKKLADELEVTQAALAVASLPARDVDSFLAALADTALDALACEFGAVVVRPPNPRLIVAPNGWHPDASEDLMLGSLLQLLATLPLEEPAVAQDLSLTAHGSPLGFGEGLVSRCVIPLQVPDGDAALVVAHTTAAPRGFTDLCQVVAATIGTQASLVLANSITDRENDGQDAVRS